MKRNNIIFSALTALAIFAVSCSKDVNSAPTPQPEEGATAEKVVITASLPEVPMSKVAMEETATGLDLKWAVTDFLTVVCGDVVEKYTIDTISEDGKSATFTGNPVEGDSFTVIYSDLGVDYLNRNYAGDDRYDNATDEKAKLPYDAVLKNVKDYTKVSFTESWAEANGAEFSQTGCLMLHMQLPDNFTDVEYVKLTAFDNVFSSTNAPNSPKLVTRCVHYNSKRQPESNGTIKAYIITPMHENVIAPGEKVRVILEATNDYRIKDIILPEGMVIMPGMRNILKVNKENWIKKTKITWYNQKTSWRAPYCNISHHNVGPGRIIDSNKTTLWQAPWNNSNNRPVIDDSYDGWTHIGTNYARAPMIGIFSFGEGLENVHSVQITRRQGSNGYLTKVVEVWISNDTSNDEEIGEEHLNQNLCTGMTNDMINGYWPKWSAKKWVKVTQINDDFNNDAKKITIHGVSFKYMMLVIQQIDDSDPVLALAELEFTTYQD